MAGLNTELFETRRREYCTVTERQLEKAIGAERGEYAVVVEAMRYAALGAGKRLRGMLTLRMCEEACGDYARAAPFAGAVELIHVYSLIHDDMPCMDDDDLRRGKPSCHIRFGEANALLAGDALLTLAFESALRDCDFAAVGYENALCALRLLAGCAGVDGMVGGQVIDLAYENSGKMDEKILHEMHSLKTGALIRASCGMGAVVGGMDAQRLELCSQYAQEIGLAFQIADDILDETSTAQALGKSIGKDRESGKVTYVTLYGIEKARVLGRECVDRAEEILAEMRVKDRFLYDLAEMIIQRSH